MVLKDIWNLMETVQLDADRELSIFVDNLCAVADFVEDVVLEQENYEQMEAMVNKKTLFRDEDQEFECLFVTVADSLGKKDDLVAIDAVIDDDRAVTIQGFFNTDFSNRPFYVQVKILGLLAPKDLSLERLERLEKI